MVKPTSGSSVARSGSNAGQSSARGRPPAAPPTTTTSSISMASIDNEDLSFVVLDHNAPPSMNGNISLISTVSQNSLMLSSDFNAEEVHKKLQEVLKENIELKEALQQNNLAMKQQFSTLSTWHEEVLSVHQSHKSKFDEMKALILKLKTDNEALSKKVVCQPKIDEVTTESNELKTKVQDLERKMLDHQAIVKENASLKDQISKLEERIATGMTSTDAQERAERRVRELAEERVQLIRDKQELQQRTLLLQEELSNSRDDGFVLVSDEPKKEQSADISKLPNPQDKLNSFYVALDKYEERLMSSYKTLESQVDSFSAVYSWLEETRAKLPCTSSSLSELGTLLEMVSLSLREAQNSSTGHRLRLEEASHQLGRLSSDFQGMLQDYLSLTNDLRNTKPELQQSTESKELQEKVDHLTGQLLEVKEKLTLKEKKITQLNISLVKTEAELNKAILEQQPKTAEPSKELKEQLDLMTAQMIEMNDILAQKDKNIEKQGLSIAQKDAKLAQMELKVSQAETKASQKETEVVCAQKKLKNVEQKVDALEAQAQVYKMDFDEERESREKLATEKEKIADELRAMQQENNQLNAELETLKKQPTQPAPSSVFGSSLSSSSRPQPHNYNTIATPGRSRGQWPSSGYEGSEQDPAPKYECPKCQLVFLSLHPLENHVEICLDQDMFLQ